MARNFAPALTALAALIFSAPLQASTPVRVVSSDNRGVTLRLDIPSWRLADAAPGFQRLIVPGFEATDVPGRAAMPFASVLVALPPGSRATARIQAEDSWVDVGAARLETAGKPVFEASDQHDLRPIRTPVPAIEDGGWPRSTVEVGEPFSLRRQRMVAVALRPFRWDASTGRLTMTRSLTVRVEFSASRSAPARSSGVTADRHWEPVLREALVNYDQARGWRERPTPSSRVRSAEINPRGLESSRIVAEDDHAEVRVKLDSTGVYELSYPELEAKGYPIGISIAQVSVHRHEFVEGATPPFVSIEIPIEVDDGNGNGIFDDFDRILLFVPTWAQRARASWPQRLWGDAEVVYATAVNGSGQRMASRAGWRDVPGLTPLPSYPMAERTERNYAYYLFPPDTLTDQFHWTEIALYYDRIDSLRFETNDLDTTHTAAVSASWVGRRIGPHFSWARFRKQGGPFITVADSISWFGTAAMTATAIVPGSTLGNINTMAVWGKGSASPPDPFTNGSDNVGFNWIETAYWRRFKPINDYLSCNSAGATGETQILAGPFSNTFVKVYDVTDSIAPVSLTIDPSHVTPVTGGVQVELQDLVGAGETHRYVIFSQPRTLTSENYTAVTRRHLTSHTGADYLLVVPEAFLPATEPLVALRQSQGLDVLVTPFESLCDEFNGGRRSDFAIKRLVRYAYDNWNSKFLLLFGDGSEDPQNLLKESSPDVIPVHKIQGPVVIQFGYEIIPSDPWYVCMENCDLSQFTPVLQDLFVGRIPVQSLAAAQAVVAKLVAYENLASDQTWRQNILLCDDDAYSAQTFFGGGSTQIGYCHRPSEAVFRQLNETVASVVRDEAGLQQAVLDTFHLDSKLHQVACLSPDCGCKDMSAVQQFTRSNITPDLISRLNAGRMWWNFQGHANEFVLTHEDLYINRGPSDDKDALLNDGKPFVFSAFSCHVNAFARFGEQGAGRGPVLGEEMVTLPVRGAIGSWASSGYEILPFSGSSHINVAWARAMFVSPPNDPNLGQSGSRVVLGETIALALANYIPTVVFNPNEKGIALTYHLLGDPATRLLTAPPVSVPPGGAPQSVALSRPFPNPVRQRAHLSYAIPVSVAGQALSIDVYDAAGRRVHRLAHGVARPGRYDLDWDLRDGRGSLVKSGLYLLVLDVGGERRSQRVVALP